MDYFERKLDDKRRLTIPTELRAEFASGIVLSRGFGEYLHMYPQQVWDREVEPALAGNNIFDEELADLFVIAHAVILIFYPINIQFSFFDVLSIWSYFNLFL